MITCSNKKAVRDEAKRNLDEITKKFKDCIVKESEDKAENKDPSRYQVLNLLEIIALKNYKMQKSYCYIRGFSNNNTRRLIGQEIMVFNKMCCYLHVNKPSTATLEEIENACANYSGLCILIGSTFSAFYLKRRYSKEEKTETLKYGRNSVRME